MTSKGHNTPASKRKTPKHKPATVNPAHAAQRALISEIVTEEGVPATVEDYASQRDQGRFIWQFQPRSCKYSQKENTT